jgi:hypothetical protein
VFSYNAAFANPLFRIKVNNIQMKETQEENAKTNTEVRNNQSAESCEAVHATALRCYDNPAAALTLVKAA